MCSDLTETPIVDAINVINDASARDGDQPADGVTGWPTLNGKCPDAGQTDGDSDSATPYVVRHDGLRNESFDCYSIIG